MGYFGWKWQGINTSKIALSTDRKDMWRFCEPACFVVFLEPLFAGWCATVLWHKHATATYFTSIWKSLFLTWIVEQNKPVIKYKQIWIPFQEGLPLQKLCLYSTPKWIIPLKVNTLQMHCASWINAQEEMSCSLLIADLLEKDGKWYDVHYN